jgi:MFS transporter, FHS family, glucose/mannose:H+ symporter
VTDLQPGTRVAYRGLALSIYVGAFVFGIVMSSLGSLLPGLVGKVGFENSAAGGLFLLMNFFMLLGSLAFGPICDRFGYRLLLLLSIVLIGTAFLTLAEAGLYRVVATALALLGLGGGALNGGTNALLNDISPERRAAALNMLGIFFGCGALSMPFLMGSLLSTLGLERILIGLAVLTVAPLCLFAAAEFPNAKHAGGIKWGELQTVLRNPLLFLFGFLLFFESGNEFTIGGWLSTFVGGPLGAAPRTAAFVLAGYWAAMMTGRLAVSRLGTRIRPHVVVTVSALVAAAGAAGLALASSVPEAAVCALAIGLGLAAIFPTTLAQAGEDFSEFSGTAFSVIFVMALTGGMTAPWLVGRIAQTSGVGVGFWVPSCSCVAIAALQWIIRSRTRVAS